MDNKLVTNPETGKQYEIISVICEGKNEAHQVEQEYAKAKRARREEARKITQQTNLPLGFPKFNDK